MSFVIEKMKDYDQLMVREKNTGWFFPVESKIQAEELSKKLNELESKPMDLHKDFEEWETLINSVQSDQIDLITSKEEYEEKSQKIIAETDFKEICEANNQKIRDNHVKKELSDLTDKINDTKIEIEYSKNRISFLKRLIDMKIELIKYGDRE